MAQRFGKSLVVALLFFSGKLFCQERNIELLTQLADSLISSFVSEQLAKPPSLCIVQPANSESSHNWFTQERLIYVLGMAGKKVFLSGPDVAKPDSQDGFLIEFVTRELAILYGEPRQGSAALTRTAKVGLSLLLLNRRNGEVLWHGALTGKKTDNVQSNQLPAIEDESIAFTRGVKSVPSNSVKLAQPLAVSVAAGVVIFLFYSLRSR